MRVVPYLIVGTGTFMVGAQGGFGFVALRTGHYALGAALGGFMLCTTGLTLTCSFGPRAR